MARKNIVQTSVGDIIFEPLQDVQVYLTKNITIIKKAAALNPGDRFLFPRQRITKKLPDILPLLRTNPIYHHAQDQIFYDVEKPITMFRKLLLESLIEQGVLPDSKETRQKVIQEGEDLTQEQYEEAVKMVLNVFDETKPAESTVRKDWLGSKSVWTYSKYAPQLISAFPSLRDFTEGESRYNAWTFWRSCNEQTMKRLHQGNENNNNGETNRNGNGKKKLTMIVDDIVNELIEEYDEESCIARVSSNNGVNTPEHAMESLRGKEEPISYKQLKKDNAIIQSYLYPVLSGYLEKKGVPKESIQDYEGLAILEFSKQHSGFSNSLLVNKIKEAEEVTDKKIHQEVMSDLMLNVPDKLLNIPQGTIRNLLSTYSTLLRATPQDIFETRLLLCDKSRGLSGRELKETTKQVKKLIRRIEERYGIGFFKREDTIWGIMDTYRRDLFSEKSPEKIRQAVLESSERHGVDIIPSSEVRECLARYGLESIAEIVPYNFILDDKNTLDFLAQEQGKEMRMQRYRPTGEWIKQAGERHTELCKYLIDNPDAIEPGLELIKSEYQFDGGWARADLVFTDEKGEILVVEVKQNATRNGNGFNNGLKGLEQIAGYTSAIKAELDYCPVTRGLNNNVRGMLIAYEIDDNIKQTLERQGYEHLEVITI